MTDGTATGTPYAEDVEVIRVSTGEYAIAQYPQVLMTLALGSCVGVALWDPGLRRGGLAHVMLPTPSDGGRTGSLMRFASEVIPEMAGALVQHTSGRRLVAKIAGGAAMFRGDSRLAGVGDRNLEEVRKQLLLLRIPILAEDTGGSHARTVELHLDTGVMVVRSYKFGIKEL
ncbi:MAG: chemotaxis protein CheD [Coriobacteriales bacterium]|nr:chemotaxis protein CheD [Actinomycetes bacterium]